jgi:hypothetical protein
MLTAINCNFVNKPDLSDKALKKLVHNFVEVDITLAQLAEEIKRGHAFCPPFKNGKKCAKNFKVSWLLCVDIDSGMTLQEAVQSRFFQEYGGMIYTTFSHSDWLHKFRIVFVLDEPITNTTDMRHAYTGLIAQYGGDKACKDASRMFYASTGTEIILADKTMPAHVVAELIERGKEFPARSEFSGPGGHHTSTDSGIRLAANLPIHVSGGDWLPFRDVPLRSQVHCPKHEDAHASAFVTQNKHGTPGIHCSTCAQTFWLDTGKTRTRSNVYDFHYNWEGVVEWDHADFQQKIDAYEERTGRRFVPAQPWKIGTRYLPSVFNQHAFASDRHPGINPVFIGLSQPYLTAHDIALRYPQFVDDMALEKATGLTMRGVLQSREQTGDDHGNPDIDYIVEEKAVLSWLQHPCISLIKSPKGSGKTKLMQSIVGGYEHYPCLPKSILFIGHRRSLINATAKELGLVSYLNTDKSGENKGEYNDPAEQYAICLDSLSTRLDTRKHHYDVVIIDEVEQVLSHLLAGTMKADRVDTLLHLQHYLMQAKHVYLLDADLNVLTTDIMLALVGEKESDAFFVINACPVQNRSLDLYQSKDHLIGELEAALLRGEKCFLSANSKALCKGLHGQLTKKYPHLKALCITSDNSDEKDVQYFINHIKEEALKYDLVVASPTVGTGIDITFPDQAQLIDHVFGVFEARINTHFDIDQQLSRVRHPKHISVWVSPEQFYFETDPAVIKQDLACMEAEFRRLERIDADGTRHYYKKTATEELFEQIYAAVKETQRASKNRLRLNFKELREANGWRVNEIDPNKDLAASGKALRKEGEQRLREQEHQRIVDARPLSDQDYRDLDGKADEQLTQADRDAMAKYDLENFFHTPVTRDLIAADKGWLLRSAVALYNNLMMDDEELAEKDVLREYQLLPDARNLRLKAITLKHLLSEAGY